MFFDISASTTARGRVILYHANSVQYEAMLYKAEVPKTVLFEAVLYKAMRYKDVLYEDALSKTMLYKACSLRDPAIRGCSIRIRALQGCSLRFVSSPTCYKKVIICSWINSYHMCRVCHKVNTPSIVVNKGTFLHFSACFWLLSTVLNKVLTPDAIRGPFFLVHSVSWLLHFMLHVKCYFELHVCLSIYI